MLRAANMSGGKAVEDEFESDVINVPALELATTNLEAPRLTMATWRQGKKRRMIRRTNHFGGQTEAPAAFLAMREKVCFKPGRPGYRVCSAMKKDGSGKCGMLSLKGMSVCAAHGGQLALARQGRLQKSGRAAAAIAEKQAKETQARSKTPEDRVLNGPSLELLRLRVYVEADEWTRLRLIRAWGTEGWHGLVRQLMSRDDPPDGDRNR
jgi:hypothetical protein